MLIVNYFVYPIQLALLLPFIRAGEWLSGSGHLDLSAELVQRMMKEDLLNTVVSLSSTIIHALFVWLLVAPIVVVSIFLIMRLLLRRLWLERLATDS